MRKKIVCTDPCFCSIICPSLAGSVTPEETEFEAHLFVFSYLIFARPGH